VMSPQPAPFDDQSGPSGMVHHVIRSVGGPLAIGQEASEKST